MAIFPVRDLASKGILRDPSPYQLDLNAWSQGLGVRFHANKVQSAPIFRLIEDSLTVTPQNVFGYEPTTGYDSAFVVGTDFSVHNYQDQTYSNVSATSCVQSVAMTAGGSGYSISNPPSVAFSSPSGGGVQAQGTAIVTTLGTIIGVVITNPGTNYSSTATVGFSGGVGSGATAVCDMGALRGADPRSVTSCTLGNVVYVNQPAGPPIFYGPNSSVFQVLPNMETIWTCRSLRAFGNYLVALNVSKPISWASPYTGIIQPAGTYGNMVKWSDLTFEGSPPPSWDPDNPNTSAGENALDQISTPIVDGLAMRQLFLIYTETSIWGMEPVGGTDVFQWQQLFSTGGLIAPNCVVEVDGLHYCFGPTDIYKTDGTTKISIVDKRNREAIYRNLNVQAGESCFVQYIPHMYSVLFCYQTGDANTWGGGNGCNMAALYDIANDTWGFVALPNVTGMTMANADTVYTYSSLPSGATYANFGGSCYDQQNTYRKSPMAVSQALPVVAGGNQQVITNSRLLGYDFMTLGWMGYKYLPEVNQPAYVERTGIALDQLGSNLTTYKRIRRVFPLVTCYDSIPVEVQIGYSNTPSGAVTWGPLTTFDPAVSYKVDTITGGRYLAIRFTVPTAVDFEIAGFDCDVSEGGRR